MFHELHEIIPDNYQEVTRIEPEKKKPNIRLLRVLFVLFFMVAHALHILLIIFVSGK